MDALPVLLETVEDGIATLTFNRPERMNALSMPIMEGLLHGLPRLAGDPAVRVIVLTGAGRAFCAGGDVKSMAEGGEQHSAAKARELYFTGRPVDAAEALTLGLVNRVVADEDLATVTMELARSLAHGPSI